MGSNTSFLNLISVLLFFTSVYQSTCNADGSIGDRRQEITLNTDGGYDLLVAIHDDITEDLGLLNTLQVSLPSHNLGLLHNSV